VLGEWNALQVAARGSAPHSRLLEPEHVPQTFLFLEYLEGLDGQKTIDKAPGNDSILQRRGGKRAP
jgi:hypothetical protein